MWIHLIKVGNRADGDSATTVDRMGATGPKIAGRPGLAPPNLHLSEPADARRPNWHSDVAHGGGKLAGRNTIDTMDAGEHESTDLG